MEEIRSELEASVEKDVLLPHQVADLKRYALQASFQRGGGARMLQGRLAEDLNITDDQKEALREKAEEVQKWMQQEQAKLRDQAMQKLIGVLDSEQQAKFKEMYGEQVDIDLRGGFSQFGSRSRGGDRGNRSGEGGGRGRERGSD